jgi:hypothetical protein
MAATQSKHLSSVLESLRAVYGAEVFASAFSLMSSVAPSAPPAASSAASSVASDPAAAPAAASSAPPKRRGPKKLAEMTPEERAVWESKKAERKAKKAEAKASSAESQPPSADGSATEPEDAAEAKPPSAEAKPPSAEAKPPSAEQKPKRGGRPKMTPEQKAEAKAKRAAKKAGGGAAPEVVDLTVGLPEGWAALCSGAPKPDIGAFESCEIEGVSYLRNCRGDLLTAEGEWAGRIVAGKFDPSVPEPADLAEVTWG